MEMDWGSVMNSALIGGVIGAIIGVVVYGLRYIIRMFSGQSKAKNKSDEISRWG